MKKFTISTFALVTAVAMSAGALDLQSRVMLQRHALEKDKGKSEIIQTADGKKSVKHHAPANSIESTMAFVRIADGFSRADLEEAGMNVLAVRGNIAIISTPYERAEEFAASPAVRKMSLQQPVKPLLDKSRASGNVDAIHQGIGLDVPYTGKNVLAGIVDQGVDPNHVMFLNDKGRSRVEYLTCFDGTADRDGVPNFSLYGDDIYDIDDSGNVFNYPQVSTFVTDDLKAYHGTHTMGILAGAYKGDVTVAKGKIGQKPALETKANPYYGVATDARLAVSCGELQDACIAFGINGILDYAAYLLEEDNVPSVLSLSLGSNSGPHDPNSLMNAFLDECGKETIVVLAAGNEGDLKIALKKDMTADDNSMATMIYPYAYQYDPSAGSAGTENTFIRQDAVLIYSNDDTPFTVKAFIMTQRNGTWRRVATYDISSEAGDYYLSDSSYANYVGGSVNTNVAKYFDGYIGGGTMLDEDLGRWYGVFDYYLFTNPATGINEDGTEAVIVGFEVIGRDGQRIECYCSGWNTWMSNYGMDGYMDGQRDGTISDMAITNNTLVVGAYTENRKWTSLNGEEYGYYEEDGFVIGDIGHYTSYGTLTDGSTLPHVCAPGTGVISAMSTPYVEDFFKGYESYIPMNFQAKATVDGRTYYWKAETGTSMSTPFVAGSIALWLEADPTLTIEDVKDIVARTARRDEFVENGIAAQWGAGKFDALAGLKEVIRRAGVGGVTVDSSNDRLILTPAGTNVFSVFVGDAAALDIKVFSTTGMCVHTDVTDGCEGVIDLSGLTPGIYIVAVNGHSKKITIK